MMPLRAAVHNAGICKVDKIYCGLSYDEFKCSGPGSKVKPEMNSSYGFQVMFNTFDAPDLPIKVLLAIF